MFLELPPNTLQVIILWFQFPLSSSSLSLLPKCISVTSLSCCLWLTRSETSQNILNHVNFRCPIYGSWPTKNPEKLNLIQQLGPWYKHLLPGTGNVHVFNAATLLRAGFRDMLKSICQRSFSLWHINLQKILSYMTDQEQKGDVWPYFPFPQMLIKHPHLEYEASFQHHP